MKSSEYFKVSYYRFKPSLDEDFKSASLVISHAGAGSIMEGLRLHKPLLVVINDDLMDNHQEELAEAMSAIHCCFYCTTVDLFSTFGTCDLSSLQAYPEPDFTVFPKFLNSIC